MTTVRPRGEAIRKFILERVAKHPGDIAALAAKRFGVTRQAINKHMGRLIDEGCLVTKGQTQGRTYHLANLVEFQGTYRLPGAPKEDAVWTNDIASVLGQLPENAHYIWNYGFTEMFNNALEHAEAQQITVKASKTAATTKIVIHDDGIGIFRKIQNALGLLDERHSVLELAKGKFTTDPVNHSGQGIFFSSRMFDEFCILSGDVFFSHQDDDQDWILEGRNSNGTTVVMSLSNHTAKTSKKVFDQFSEDDDFGFTKTVVPVELAQHGDELLVSRSQAKRLLARVDRFKTVILDFDGVKTIGQAFADEIFRVFVSQHPEVKLLELHTVPDVQRMIERARSDAHTPPNQLVLPIK